VHPFSGAVDRLLFFLLLFKGFFPWTALVPCSNCCHFLAQCHTCWFCKLWWDSKIIATIYQFFALSPKFQLLQYLNNFQVFSSILSWVCWLFAKVIEISEEVLGITTIPYNILMHVTHGQFVYLSHSGVQRFVT